MRIIFRAIEDQETVRIASEMVPRAGHVISTVIRDEDVPQEFLDYLLAGGRAALIVDAADDTIPQETRDKVQEMAPGDDRPVLIEETSETWELAEARERAIATGIIGIMVGQPGAANDAFMRGEEVSWNPQTGEIRELNDQEEAGLGGNPP